MGDVAGLAGFVTKAQAVIANLGSYRRTMSWLNELPPLIKIPSDISLKDPIDRTLALMEHCGLALFFMLDHLAWLKLLGILRGGKRAGVGTRLIAFKFMLLSVSAGFLQLVRKRSEVLKSQKTTHNINTLRSAAMVVVFAQLSEVKKTSELTVPLLGTLTAAYDVKTMWPKK